MSEDAPRAGAEAARLLAAAQDWLSQSAPHLAPVDGSGQTCSCPLCRGIVRLREGDPDAVARWVDGAVAAFERVVADASAPRPAAPPADADADHADAGDVDPMPPSEPDAAESERPPTRRVRRVPLDDAGSQDPSTADPADRPTAREE
jgi:hypothetical protein